MCSEGHSSVGAFNHNERLRIILAAFLFSAISRKTLHYTAKNDETAVNRV